MQFFRKTRRKAEEPPRPPDDRTDEQILIDELIALLRERIEAAPLGRWRVLGPIGRETRERAQELLGRVHERVGPDQHDYFDTARERYLAILSLILPILQPGARVLDVGCAPGHIAMALTLAGAHVDGIDLNDEYRPKYPSAEWLERLSIRSLDIEKHALPYADGEVDWLLFTEVLEHVATRPPGELIDEFCRVLRPGGRLLLTVPNLANASQVAALAGLDNVMWRPEIFYGCTDRHNREYVPAEVDALLEGRFERIDRFMLNTEHNWNSATNNLVRDLCHRAEACTDHPLFFNTLLVRARRA